MGKNNTAANISPLHTGDNKFAFSNQEKADVLNNFFISISDIEEANIPLPNLSKLFNLSLEQHIYPNLWKTASVMPLFKKGKTSDEAVLMSTHNLCSEQKQEKYQNFLSEKFLLVVKFSIYLNRHVL